MTRWCRSSTTSSGATAERRPAASAAPFLRALSPSHDPCGPSRGAPRAHPAPRRALLRPRRSRDRRRGLRPAGQGTRGARTGAPGSRDPGLADAAGRRAARSRASTPSSTCSRCSASTTATARTNCAPSTSACGGASATSSRAGRLLRRAEDRRPQHQRDVRCGPAGARGDAGRRRARRGRDHQRAHHPGRSAAAPRGSAGDAWRCVGRCSCRARRSSASTASARTADEPRVREPAQRGCGDHAAAGPVGSRQRGLSAFFYQVVVPDGGAPAEPPVGAAVTARRARRDAGVGAAGRTQRAPLPGHGRGDRLLPRVGATARNALELRHRRCRGEGGRRRASGRGSGRRRSSRGGRSRSSSRRSRPRRG